MSNSTYIVEPPVAISINNITKEYGKKIVLDNVSFTVSRGKVTLLAGPNGAGKSTLLRIICGVEDPSYGSISFDCIEGNIKQAPTSIGAVLDPAWLNTSMTASENLAIFARLGGFDLSRVSYCLHVCGLSKVADQRLSSFSLGMRQRCTIAAALLGEPQILILDEPINGLDPAGIMWFDRFIQKFTADGNTVLLSSHFLSDSETMASDIVIIGQGKTLFQGSIEQLLEINASCCFSSFNNSAVIRRLNECVDNLQIEEKDNVVTVNVEPRVVSAAARSTGTDLIYLQSRRRTLLSAFSEISAGAVEFS